MYFPPIDLSMYWPTDEYRIVQVSDTQFAVERMYILEIEGEWRWFKPRKIEERRTWQRGHPTHIGQMPMAPLFPSEAAAQKWVDDKRNYPFVVKQPA